ncbi:MAG: hypothetical protein HXY34_06480 [Candidatus Thorarchaeota archaeon]|nr:hypothetical protein [Candidatus Thorarchaeota archaeon]
MDLGLFIVGLGLITGFLLITMVFGIRERKTRRKVYFIKEATALGSLTGITNVALSGPEFNPLGLASDLILRITLSFWVLTFALMGLFFMALRQEFPDWRVASLVTFLGTTTIICGFASLSQPALEGNILALVWKAGFALYSIVVFLHGARVFHEANQRQADRRSAVIALSLVTISISYVINVVLYDVPNFQGTPLLTGLSVEMVLDLLRISMMLMIVIALITDIEYMYRLPVDVYSISVIRDSGVYLYSYGHDPDVSDPGLLSSAICAMSLFMKETSKSASSLRRVSTSNRAILIEPREDEGVIFVAVVERATLVLLRSLQLFADQFVQRYPRETYSDIVNPEDYADASQLVYTAFPFLKRCDVAE